jgi:soluble lytic murein transglycosylase-like protein
MKLVISLLTILFISANYPQDVKQKESDLLIYAQQKMDIDDYVSMMRAIEIGERYYNVDRDIVLAVIFIESDFKVNAVNIKTLDYGLSQQNDKYYLDRYKLVSKILDAEKIRYNINNKYDIYLNVLSCFYYLDHCINLKDSKSQGVKKYNGTGKRADAYLDKFLGVYYDS